MAESPPWFLSAKRAAYLSYMSFSSSNRTSLCHQNNRVHSISQIILCTKGERKVVNPQISLDCNVNTKNIDHVNHVDNYVTK